MAPDLNLCYEFDAFVLIPKDRILLHLNQPVALLGKDFDILSYLVQHPNNLIQTAELIEAVWGSGSTLGEGNITNHIAKIRKAVGCDPRHPRFIKTAHGKEGYRFIAPVQVKECDEITISAILGANSSSQESGIPFEISSHLFVPVYLGTGVYDHIRGKVEESRWVRYKEFKIDGGRLCISSSGFGVWHLNQTRKFSHFWELTAWRKKEYDKILSGNHVMNVCTKDLISSIRGGCDFSKVLGVPGYVFSAFILVTAVSKRQETIRNTLELLSSPSTFELRVDTKSERERLVRLERQSVERGLNGRDNEEFGLTGVDLGFANWDAASYVHQSKNNKGLEESIIEFEIAVQLLWWTGRCLTDLFLSNDLDEVETVRKYIRELKLQYSKIKDITATESPSQRTMIEAVLSTSRIKQVVEQALELYSEYEG